MTQLWGSPRDAHQLALGLGTHRREAFYVGRAVAAVVLGIVLLALSAIINIAKGAAIAGWSPLWIGWAVTAAIVIVIAFGASTLRGAWGGLCFIGFLASMVLLAALPWFSRAAETTPQSTAELARSLGLTAPAGAALGGAIFSGAVGIAAVVLMLAFMAASYFLLYRKHDRHVS